MTYICDIVDIFLHELVLHARVLHLFNFKLPYLNTSFHPTAQRSLFGFAGSSQSVRGWFLRCTSSIVHRFPRRFVRSFSATLVRSTDRPTNGPVGFSWYPTVDENARRVKGSEQIVLALRGRFGSFFDCDHLQQVGKARKLCVQLHVETGKARETFGKRNFLSTRLLFCLFSV